MKLREFIGKVTASPAAREIIPYNQNLLYPQFSVSRGQLCLRFIGHTAAVLEDGEALAGPLADYRKVLAEVLEPEQMAAYDRLLRVN